MNTRLASEKETPTAAAHQRLGVIRVVPALGIFVLSTNAPVARAYLLEHGDPLTPAWISAFPRAAHPPSRSELYVGGVFEFAWGWYAVLVGVSLYNLFLAGWRPKAAKPSHCRQMASAKGRRCLE